MIAERIDIDSLVLGRNVLSLGDWCAEDDFPALERDYIAKFDPGYVYTKLPLESVAQIHNLEGFGFKFIECQIRSLVKLRQPRDLSAFSHYAFEPVTREEDLGPVLDIAASTFVFDRWRVDPALNSDLAGARYRRYVEKSFVEQGEWVYRLFEKSTGTTLAFKTHAVRNDQEVLFLLGGVHPEYKNLGLGLLNEYFEFNALIARGVTRGVTHISAANEPVFNLEIGRLGFRVQATFAVLRKLYS